MILLFGSIRLDFFRTQVFFGSYKYFSHLAYLFFNSLFFSHSGSPAIQASYKTAVGFLYPLERGFIFVHKPPVYLRFEEIAFVNFSRSTGSNRSFDFEIESKANATFTFSSIDKFVLLSLYSFILSIPFPPILNLTVL